MALQFSNKENLLLEDIKNYEQLCIGKYSKNANEAQEQQLKNLFQTIGSKEQQHLDTINTISSGQLPTLNQGQQNPIQQSPDATTPGAYSQCDAYLCNDVLAAEKHASSIYDTAIFEFQDTNVRNILNHIQKEEQEHGEAVFNYMKSHGMYNVG